MLILRTEQFTYIYAMIYILGPTEILVTGILWNTDENTVAGCT